jgi:GDP-L-fucose synthase
MQIKTSIKLDAPILITGGTGLIGKSLTNLLEILGYTNVLSIGSSDCDLRDGKAVSLLLKESLPEYVFHLAARVHGLGGNSLYKSDILVDNVLINTNVIEQSRRSGVKKIVAMGSGCVYPELKGEEELFEHQIWLGPPHPSEDSYAHSKRLMLAQLDAAKNQYGLSSAFVISGNLYGPNDNFNISEGHVIPSLIAKFYNAKKNGTSVRPWGTGRAVRDFTYSDDAATALFQILQKIEGPINMGSSFRHPISDIVNTLHDITGVNIEWDNSMPDGQLLRYYNLDKLSATGFVAKTHLIQGIKKTYDWFVDNQIYARK